jgi:hypothetical protein
MSGIKTNSSDKHVMSSGAKWTGVVNMKIAAINPTMEEMKAMGMNPQREPEYFTERENKRSFRLDVYLYNAERKINAKAAFFLESRARWNKDVTKVEWINKFGSTSWSGSESDVPSYDWFKKDGARPALVGEAVLTSFIAAWANTGPEDQCIFDDPKALAEGKLAEIKALLATIPNNEVQVLLGVKPVTGNDGTVAYYQDVYTGYFDRPYRKAYDKWKKQLESEYGAFKSDYQGDLNLRTYDKAAVIKQDTPTDLNVPEGAQQPGATKSPYNF